MVPTIGAIGNHIAIFEQTAHDCERAEIRCLGQTNASNDLRTATVSVFDVVTHAGGLVVSLANGKITCRLAQHAAESGRGSFYCESIGGLGAAAALRKLAALPVAASVFRSRWQPAFILAITRFFPQGHSTASPSTTESTPLSETPLPVRRWDSPLRNCHMLPCHLK